MHTSKCNALIYKVNKTKWWRTKRIHRCAGSVYYNSTSHLFLFHLPYIIYEKIIKLYQSTGILMRTSVTELIVRERPTIIKFCPPPASRCAWHLAWWQPRNANYSASRVGALSVLMAYENGWWGREEIEIRARIEREWRRREKITRRSPASGRERARVCARISLYDIFIPLVPFPFWHHRRHHLWWFLAARTKGRIGDWVSAVKPNPRESCVSSSSSLERKKRLDDATVDMTNDRSREASWFRSLTFSCKPLQRLKHREMRRYISIRGMDWEWRTDTSRAIRIRRALHLYS